MPNLRRLPQAASGPRDGQMLVRQAMESLGLSARAYGKILKVSRTIADLEGCENIQSQHVSEAVNYRTLERTLE